MFSTKIGTHVSFPLEGLDLQPFLAKDSPAQIVIYDLLSVICHHGTASSEYITLYLFFQAFLYCFMLHFKSLTWTEISWKFLAVPRLNILCY